MEYDIRFCQTVEGRRIAYGVIGSGPPVVISPAAGSHLELELARSPLAPLFLALAARFTVVRYDRAGTGLSQREIPFQSEDALVHEFEAVVEAAGLDRFSALGISAGGPATISYVVRHPERIDRLVFYGSFAERPGPHPLNERVAALRQVAPEIAARDFIERMMPTGGTREYIKQVTEYMIEADSGEGPALMAGIEWPDQRALLSQITAPTLVLHCLEDQVVPVSGGRKLAALIPGARFQPLPGPNHGPASEEEALALAGRIIDFLFEGIEQGTDVPAASGLQTILFTDLESSTALTQRVGDAAAQEVLHGHNQVVRRALAANGGREVKHTGDGIMAAFGSAVRAVEAAVQIQRDLAGGEVRVRVGLNAGEPIAEDGDFFGSAVQMAARVCDRAEPGQVVVAQVVRDLCRGKNFPFEDLGQFTLKGYPEPERLFGVTVTPPD